MSHVTYITSMTLFIGNKSYLSNSTTSKVPLTSTVNLINSPDLIFWKSKVRSPTIPDDRYFHVAEPSFGSNGTLVFYTANHFLLVLQKVPGGNMWIPLLISRDILLEISLQVMILVPTPLHLNFFGQTSMQYTATNTVFIYGYGKVKYLIQTLDFKPLILTD